MGTGYGWNWSNRVVAMGMVVRQCGAVRWVWCSGDAGADTGAVRVATLWQAVVQSSSGVDVSRRLMSDAM